jgi:hypothetical protein
MDSNSLYLVETIRSLISDFEVSGAFHINYASQCCVSVDIYRYKNGKNVNMGPVYDESQLMTVIKVQLDDAWLGSFYVITDVSDKEWYSNAPCIRPLAARLVIGRAEPRAV